METIGSIGLIEEKIPYVKTVLGLLNILFGLAAVAREVVNAVLLYDRTEAGFDLTIVNAEKLEGFAGIPEEERRLAEALLLNTPPVNVAADHLNATSLEVRSQDHSLQDATKNFLALVCRALGNSARNGCTRTDSSVEISEPGQQQAHERWD